MRGGRPAIRTSPYLLAAAAADFVQRGRDNFNVHIHVIGDRATRMARPAAAREKGSKRLRPGISR
jgi:hypothetical protein